MENLSKEQLIQLLKEERQISDRLAIALAAQRSASLPEENNLQIYLDAMKLYKDSRGFTF